MRWGFTRNLWAAPGAALGRAGNGSGRSPALWLIHRWSRRKERLSQHWFYFCSCSEPVKQRRGPGPALPEEPARANGAEEEDVWLPQTDLPRVIQQKVIPGYTGFIPRLSWFHGVNYVRGVKEAMKEFDQHQVHYMHKSYFSRVTESAATPEVVSLAAVGLALGL
ncbi:hypothetical protein AAES_105448 [Amazona aestiva]|uniref:Uncharacterized protein n=1 Tax=Amazona aestiva TaxID=12930 RepID=A0A0Q3M9F8_AMAAE|nr:hypothetical protein AAES_105448 [Amazona aestiva]